MLPDSMDDKNTDLLCRTRQQGFTLVEIMVAVAVCSLLLIMLLAVAMRMSDIWQGGNRQAQQGRNTRALLDSISRELSVAMLPLADKEANKTGNLQFIVNPAALSASIKNSDSIFWQAPIAQGNDAGDIAELGYFVRWIGNKAALCRFYINPADHDNYLLYAENPDAWLSDQLVNKVTSATQSANANDSYQGLFAENVIGFWVTCYEYDSAGHLSIVSSDGKYDSRMTKKLPQIVQIDMVQIDNTSAARVQDVTLITNKYGLARKADGTVDMDAFIGALPDSLRSSARAYSTRVFLQNTR